MLVSLEGQMNKLELQKIAVEVRKGIIKGVHYPNDRFWDIAASVRNEVLISCDAHRPEVLSNQRARGLSRSLPGYS